MTSRKRSWLRPALAGVLIGFVVAAAVILIAVNR